MTPTIIKNVRGRDIPPQWMKNVGGRPDQIFTLIITPEIKPGEKMAINESLSKRNMIFDMLEGVSGCESSEEWISLIKTSHKNSSVKTDFQ